MVTIKNYVKVETLEEAYQLNQRKTNVILGGMLWMKMGQRNIQTAIDLSGLELDRIEEDAENFYIGAMCSLRTLELDQRLEKAFQGVIKESVRHIVGVQFRNGATVGGSIFGRFGFSDVLTCFLALDTYVELYKGGTIPLQEFIDLPRNQDVLVRVIIKKDCRTTVYQSFRKTQTDLPILASSVSLTADKLRVVIGARPMKAAVIECKKEEILELNNREQVKVLAGTIAGQFQYESNMRGSAEYREHLAAVSIVRAIEKLKETIQ